MNLIFRDMQRATIQSGVVITLTHIDHILLYIGRNYKQRLCAATNAQTLALTDGVEVCAVVLADLLAVAHRVAERLRHRT